jgi:hypothetical protein
MSGSFRIGDDARFAIPPPLQHALAAADARHRASLDRLRDAICAYITDLRGQGVPAGHIATAVRRRVAQVRASGLMVAAGAPDDLLLDQIMRSCLDGDGEIATS